MYLFHSQNRDIIHRLNGEDFELYGAKYLHKQQEEKQGEKLMELSDPHQKVADVDDGEYEQLSHDYAVHLDPTKGGKSPHIQEYVDEDLSKNFRDIHDMDNVDVLAADDSAEPRKSKRDFNYPEVGYRYQSVFTGSQRIPDSTLLSVEKNQTNIKSHKVTSPPAKVITLGKLNLSNVTVTKNNKKQPNVNPTKKTQKKRPVSNTIMPPPLTDGATKQPANTSYLVYLCDSSYLCGGWGDRQRGIVSTYLLSRLIDRQMKIIMTTPCNLRLFYKPNKVQWLPSSNELISDSNISINALMDKSFQHSVMDGDFNIRFPQKVVYLKTNQDYYDRLKKNTHYSAVLDQWGGLGLRRSRFHWAWDELMQPSHMLLAHLQHIVGTQFLIRKGFKASSLPAKQKTTTRRPVDNSSLICAHVRMGKNPTIPMDEYLKSFKLEYLPTLFKFMLSKDVRGDAKFFVATDYDHVRSESVKFFGNRTIDYGGKIVHIDRQRSEHSACVGFEVALMDQLILSLCDILVVCKSGFSINASYMSKSVGQIYFMKDGNIDLFNG